VLIVIIIMIAIGCAARTAPQNLSTAVDTVNHNRTIWEGVYTEDQSQRGEAIYIATCNRCHGPELGGSQVVPGLVGEHFLTKWRWGTAGDLFERMRTSMPPILTERLTPPEYADVLAYILSKNQLPTGQEELADDFATLRVIRMAPSE
jgi:mono/diheme cytochrome c family protein